MRSLIAAACMVGSCVVVEGATFSNVSTGSVFFRTHGSVGSNGNRTNQDSVLGGTTSVEAELEPGSFILSSLTYEISNPDIDLSFSEVVTDPVTFETKTFVFSVSFDQVSVSLWSTPQGLIPNGANFAVYDENGMRGSISLDGEFTIQGPETTLQQSFSMNLAADPYLLGFIYDLDYPNGFDLQFSDSIGFDETNGTLFDGTLDGEDVSYEFALVNISPQEQEDIGSGIIVTNDVLTMDQVPEPGVTLLVGLSGLLLLRRRPR